MTRMLHNTAASDAQLQSALTASPTKVTPDCCNAAAQFNAPVPPCACDATIQPVAQSQGFDKNALFTIQSRPHIFLPLKPLPTIL